MEKISSKICLAGDIGVSGNMYGGMLLFLLDQAAAIYAIQASGGEKMVTRHFSEIEFHLPIRVGEIMEFWADNPVRGRTSLTFDMLVIVGHETRFRANCTFVAVDFNGNKKAIDWEKADRR